MKREIDLYAEWHPQDGFRFCSQNWPDPARLEESRKWLEFNKPHGCQIRPIYLVDASPDSKEAVVPKELLEWVNIMRDYLRACPEESDEFECNRAYLAKLNAIYPKEEGK